MGALARTHCRDKNPWDDSARITRGLGGSCWVHKPEVPHGPASQQKLGLADNVANDAKLLGQPKYLTIDLKGDLISDQKAWPRGTAPASDFGPPLRPKGLAEKD